MLSGTGEKLSPRTAGTTTPTWLFKGTRREGQRPAPPASSAGALGSARAPALLSPPTPSRIIRGSSNVKPYGAARTVKRPKSDRAEQSVLLVTSLLRESANRSPEAVRVDSRFKRREKAACDRHETTKTHQLKIYEKNT